MTAVPQTWYNIRPDLPFPVPKELPAAQTNGRPNIGPQVPMDLIRQSSSATRREIPIPEAVGRAYEAWRPTPLRRAAAFERALGTTARIYYKYEGENVSGSHKLTTALAQAYYYRKAGVERLVTGTGAGQWGTAMAAAAESFDMAARVYMVALSYEQKPYRRTMMQMFDASVVPSPSPDTESGRRFLAEHADARGNLALAIGESLDDVAGHPGSRFCIGSGEDYSLLHQTVIGIEAKEQLDDLGVWPDAIYASIGAGSNFGGITLPFLGEQLRGGRSSRYVAVEPANCPKMTKGVYAYDYTDYSGTTPMEKMYTLGSRFVTPSIHAGGLRYHATSKVVSALYDEGLVEAEAYSQADVFASGRLFCRAEGILPAPEAAHAVHAAAVAARRAAEEGTSPCLLICVSGHGYFDLGAYADALSGALDDDEVLTEADFAAGRAELPTVSV